MLLLFLLFLLVLLVLLVLLGTLACGKKIQDAIEAILEDIQDFENTKEREKEQEHQKDFAERGQVTEIRNAALGMVNAVIGGYDADIVDTTDGSTIGAGLTTPSIGAHGTSFSRSSSSNTSRRMVAPPRAIVKLTNVSRNLHGIQESKQAIRIECEKRKLVQADNECKRIENEAKRLAMQEQDAKAMRDMMMTAMAKQFGNQ